MDRSEQERAKLKLARDIDEQRHRLARKQNIGRLQGLWEGDWYSWMGSETRLGNIISAIALIIFLLICVFAVGGVAWTMITN